MGKLFKIVLLGCLITAPGARAQSLAGPNSYPAPGSGLRVYPTPSMPYPRLPYTHKKAMPRKASNGQGKFYPLYPTPKATPLRSQKLKPLPAQGTVLSPASRQAHYPLPPPKPLSPPNPRPLPPNGVVSVMGPRSLNYHTLYQNPTPVYP
jgi:hypothetical protein